MTAKQAVHILMLSPCYWMLSLPDRKQLVRDYCATYTAMGQASGLTKKPSKT